jgi:hypothetical protein
MEGIHAKRDAALLRIFRILLGSEERNELK